MTRTVLPAAGRQQQQQQQQQEQQEKHNDGKPLYFSVLYGDNRTAMFNISCHKQHLVSAIRRRCRLDRATKIELSSLTGELMNLTQKADTDTMDSVISNRDRLVLCKLEDSKHPSIEPRLVPLIDSLSELPELEQLVQETEQRVAEKEAKLTQRQMNESSRRRNLNGASRLGEQGGDAASGAVKGRQALRKLMLINKMKRKS